MSRALLAIGAMLVSLPAHGRPGSSHQRVAVIVGSNIGDSGDERLLYAERDVRRIRDVLLQIGGVRSGRLTVQLRRSRAAVLGALTRAHKQVTSLRAAGHPVTFLFYYSGHGDDTSLHLPRGNLALSTLRQAIAKIPANLKISILDACRTSQSVKGIRKGPAFELAITPAVVQGTVELRASAAGEPAQESHRLGGSLFTSYLVSGLRGAADTDGDGRVTLAEIYSHVYRRTLARSVRGGSLQHPSLAMKTAGSGELILTRPAKASASLLTPAGGGQYLIFHKRTTAVIAEVSAATASRIALPPGKFLVARRRGGQTSVAEVDLSWGGIHRLSKRSFRPISREQLAVRGGTLELNPMGVRPYAGLELCVECAEEPGLRTGAVVSYARGSLFFAFDLGYVSGGVDTIAFSGNQKTVVAGAHVAWRWSFGRPTLALLGGVEFRYAWQRLQRHDGERGRRAGLSVSADSAYGAVGPRLGAQLTLALAHRLAATLSVWSGAIFRPESDGKSRSTAVRAMVSPLIGVGYAF